MNTLMGGVLVLTVWTAEAQVHQDYYQAYREARDGKKMLLIDFESGFNFNQLSPEFLERHVICSVPLGFEIESGRLIDHKAFKALEGAAGVAVVDLQHDQQFGKAVSVLPKRHCASEKIAALLHLPAGTLTQRTLIWALRIHPSAPRSVWGQAQPQLMQHASRHSGVQAVSNHQHHDMSHPGSSEIVAESWPWNKNIADAAIDIVWSWSQSSGHWGAACRAWNCYGYDMKTNGQKWYATGVFSE